MSSEAHKKQIGLAVATALKPLGFRRKGQVFTRQLGEVTHILSLQSSTSSTASLLKITVNLGVWVSSLAEDGSKPALWSAHWCERLGFLMPQRIDYWWEISSDHDAEFATRQIVEAIQTYAVPQLEQLASRDALVALWRAGRSPGLTDFQAKRYLDRIEHESAT
jgi:hypothetical protein